MIIFLRALAALQLFGKNFTCSGQNNSWQKSSADIWTSGRAGKIAGRPYCSFKFAVISIYFYALVATFFTPPSSESAHSGHPTNRVYLVHKYATLPSSSFLLIDVIFDCSWQFA